jgi:molybdopterin molybdotransferase
MKRAITDEELRRQLLPYDDAIRLVTGSFAPLEPRSFDLADALDLVAAEDVISDVDVPGFRSSAMDGYAVRAVDVARASREAPAILHVTDDLPAGAGSSAALEPGSAATIMTGGPVPDGADAVVPWEETDRGEERVAVYAAVASGKHIRPQGEDLGIGDVVARLGDLLDPVRLGMLASIGRTSILAHPRPRVAVLSTGDELVTPGDALSFGRVYDANTTLISSLVRSAKAEVVATASIGDDPDAIGAWLTDVAPKADLIVTSGGASVGTRDWLRDVLQREGELAMWRVAVKPGKPVALGTIGGTPVIVLPGNPGSAFAGMHCFVLPAIRTMLGRSSAHRTERARLTTAVAGSPSRTQLTRVQLDGENATPLAEQSSVVLSNLAAADGYAIVPPGGLDEGETVRVELFDR